MENLEEAMRLKQFDTTIRQAFEIAASGGEIAAQLADIDRMMAEANAAQRRAVAARIAGPILDRFRAQPQLLGPFNFASGLTSRKGSRFFLELMGACVSGEEFTAEEAVCAAGAFRRAERYEALNRISNALGAKLAGDDSAEAHKTMAKLMYELSLAARRRAELAKAVGDEELAAKFYGEAIQLGEQSADEADQANDIRGKLHAKMNIGALMHDMGRLDEAASVLTQTCDEAEAYAEAATDKDDRISAWRIAMNTTIRLLDIDIKNGRPAEDIVAKLEKLKQNEAYQLFRQANAARAEAILVPGSAYVAGK